LLGASAAKTVRHTGAAGRRIGGSVNGRTNAITVPHASRPARDPHRSVGHCESGPRTGKPASQKEACKPASF